MLAFRSILPIPLCLEDRTKDLNINTPPTYHSAPFSDSYLLAVTV